MKQSIQSAANRNKLSPILVMLTPCSDYDFERSNINLKENKPDGVELYSDGHDYCVQRTKEKLYGFWQIIYA